MKNQFSFILTILGVMVLLTSSCEHSCICKVHSSYNPETTNVGGSNVRGSKKHAEKECEKRSTAANQDGSYTTCGLQ